MLSKLLKNNMNLTIIKLGGSVITNKQVAGEVNSANIERIAGIISKYSKDPMIIIHGAGSCGHHEAKEFGLKDGINKDNVIGVYKTHKVVSKLNDYIVSKLNNAGICAIGVHPFDFLLSENGRIKIFEISHIKKMIEIGIIPVLHGDVVMDNQKGVSIISGDQLVLWFARELKANRVGLATDVSGVLSVDGVIPKINRDNINQIKIGNSSNIDVTGGMAGKVNELLGLSDSGICSSIFHIDMLDRFLSNKDHKGTDVC